MDTTFTTTVLGYPRIGPRRELKRAVESYWAGRIDVDELQRVAADLRRDTWAQLAESLDSVPSNTFSFYDQVLDAAVLFDAVPQRFRDLGLSDVDTYFAMARGRDGAAAMELTKWFDSNYHYLVPELAPDTRFRLAGDKPVAEFTEALRQGVPTRPVLLGPVTFLKLAKPFLPELLDGLLDCYAELLGRLADAGAEWVQLDEPAGVPDLLQRVYQRLGGLTKRPKLLVTGEVLPALADAPVEGLGVDFVTSPELADRIPGLLGLRDKLLVAGVVDGRNVWRTDLRKAAALGASLLGSVGSLAVSSSSSLLHVPYDLDAEIALPQEVRDRLAFAKQKVAEIKTLGEALRDGVPLPAAAQVTPLRNEKTRERLSALRPEDRSRADYDTRAAAQQQRLGLPALATTTIGSFPQTGDIRKARAQVRAGSLTEAQYDERMRAEIERVIRLQEEIGLDVLVHGEPERNDMVQYFAENLDGFATTELGWVQSYGSRCVRPPILHGDVSRPRPMTVAWSEYAQSLTDKPVKGMLTGPVTILAWSFVRDDQPLGQTADQVALALRDEIADLEAAGIGVVQVDEPALRETLPLREEDRPAYLRWAVDSFRLATAGAAVSTQIHTHLCYSEFGDVITAIDGLDADVTTIEAARSKMEVLEDLRAIGFRRGVGPGVYDIHSPLVPDEEQVVGLLKAALDAVPRERLWVNPDCGLKTRGYGEVDPSLRALVGAARVLR
ncbi:5-methyltetrahydropteroyltriglutamate--homocysteine S-methyltransferase [Kutzneria sp. CA-103260]|uniref:5-methyltetrahydropteroyltriglutamate-- homocysteine S-methyltransferase n=1 Tax=Kutzneria sp. CA-103260 TaxID=2802641 RepID=UPI001BAD7076|nr:5-methyltetrahydropteroyltriglutamate--homocysteine S-methyltransferase [Kutzneria sp. CA-103260]QUQ67679.1 5-methyltetrahydropteroyltriglutamate-- homocysteine S-methyltransferase [Kutzneria sp. CA-103260]